MLLRPFRSSIPNVVYKTVLAPDYTELLSFIAATIPPVPVFTSRTPYANTMALQLLLTFLILNEAQASPTRISPEEIALITLLRRQHLRFTLMLELGEASSVISRPS